MTIAITIEVNGQLIDRIEVEEALRLETGPDGRSRYTLRELERTGEGMRLRTHPEAVLHRRNKGALVLASKALELLARRRKVGL